MLSEKKPSERRAALDGSSDHWSPSGVELWTILDEHHAAILALQRAQSPSTGGSVAEGDALEMLKQLAQGGYGDIKSDIEQIIATLEAERARYTEALIAEGRAHSITRGERDATQSALTAEQRAHKETKVTLEGCEATIRIAREKLGVSGPGSLLPAIAQLQRDLAERTRERDTFESACVKALNERDTARRERDDFIQQRDDARKARDSYERSAFEGAQKLIADRDRLQAELAEAKRSEESLAMLIQEKLPYHDNDGEGSIAEPEECVAEAAKELERLERANESLRPQSSEDGHDLVSRSDALSDLASGGKPACCLPLKCHTDAPCDACAAYRRAQSSEGTLRAAVEQELRTLQNTALGPLNDRGHGRLDLCKSLLAAHPAPSVKLDGSDPSESAESLAKRLVERSIPGTSYHDLATRLLKQVRAENYWANSEIEAVRTKAGQDVAAFAADSLDAHHAPSFVARPIPGAVMHNDGPGVTIGAPSPVQRDGDTEALIAVARGERNAKLEAQAERDALRARVEKAVMELRKLENSPLSHTPSWVKKAAAGIANALTTHEKATASETGECAHDNWASDGETRECIDCHIEETIPRATTDAAPPTPGVAERIVKRLERERAYVAERSEGREFRCFEAALRIVREEFSKEPKQATAEIPGIKWLKDDEEREFALIETEGESSSWQVLRTGKLCIEADNAEFHRDAVRDTLIPLLSRFVATGKLKGGDNG